MLSSLSFVVVWGAVSVGLIALLVYDENFPFIHDIDDKSKCELLASMKKVNPLAFRKPFLATKCRSANATITFDFANFS